MPCIRHGAGLLFCPTAIQPHTNIYSGLCAVNAIIPPQQQNRLQDFTGVFRRFALFQRTQYSSHTSRLYTACTTLEGIPSSAAPPPMPRYHRHAGRCTGQHSRPIIIRYIRAQRCGISQTMPARRGSPAAGARLAERNHWRLPPYPFSGFRPIANRGQQ